MMHWPSEQGVLYTIVISNIDINSRRNRFVQKPLLLFNTLKSSQDFKAPKTFFYFFCRTLSEFWHWFVANVPGNSIDDGQEIFQLLHPLVLPEGSGDHR